MGKLCWLILIVTGAVTGCGIPDNTGYLGASDTETSQTPDSNEMDSHNTDSDVDTAIRDSDGLLDSGSYETVLPLTGGKMTWVVMEPGTFTAGSPISEYRRDANEIQRTISITHRYAILSTEVTCQQWQSLPTEWANLCEPSGCPQDLDCSDRCTDDTCPATPMDTNAATAWLDALSESEGLTPCYKNADQFETPIHCPGYRLPTESEWERAARAGDTRATYNGDFDSTNGKEILSPIAWCGEAAGAEGPYGARPVATRQPNAAGLYDMIGNLEELALWEGEPMIPTPDSPYGDLSTHFIAERGGHFNNWASEYSGCRAAQRHITPIVPNMMSITTGLRPVRTLSGGTLPKAQQINLCIPTAVIPDECETSLAAVPVLRHALAADAEYVGMAVGENVVAFIGNSQSKGAYVEFTGKDEGIFTESQNDGYRVTYFPETEQELRGARIVSRRVGGNAFLALLCNPVDGACFLYNVNSGEEPSLKPVENGAVPQWLGDSVTLLYLDDTQIFAAGTGVASFDGTAWKEEVAPTMDINFNAIDGFTVESAVTVAVAGTAGTLLVKDENGWQSLDTQTAETFFSLHIENNYVTGLNIDATGSGGMWLTGSQHHFSACTLGAENWEDIILPHGRYSERQQLLSANGFVIELMVSYSSSGTIPACSRSILPEKWLSTMTVLCGDANNYVHLAEDGIYTADPYCWVE